MTTKLSRSSRLNRCSLIRSISVQEHPHSKVVFLYPTLGLDTNSLIKFLDCNAKKVLLATSCSSEERRLYSLLRRFISGYFYVIRALNKCMTKCAMMCNASLFIIEYHLYKQSTLRTKTNITILNRITYEYFWYQNFWQIKLTASPLGITQDINILV